MLRMKFNMKACQDIVSRQRQRGATNENPNISQFLKKTVKP